MISQVPTVRSRSAWQLQPRSQACTWPASKKFEPIATSRGLLNDFTRGLAQQMFFWGRDVVSSGNLLLGYGFERRPSAGLQGTSCYRKSWCDGCIELHGACAGWYPSKDEADGLLFIRTDRRCYAHEQREPVIPGRYEYSCLHTRDVERVLAAARAFASWLVEYESWIFTRDSASHRGACFRMYSRLPTVRPWLPPDAARRWFASFACNDPALRRSRSYR